MKNAITYLSLLFVSQASFGAQTEIYSLKNGGLKFVPTYQQGLHQIKQTDSRIQLIPMGGEMQIPFAVLCAEVKLSEKNFQKLSMIKIDAQSKVPSAQRASPYGGTTSIGSDRLVVSVDFPNFYGDAQDSYKIGASFDVTSVDPNLSSTQNMAISFDRNTVDVGGQRSASSMSPIGKYHSMGFFAFLKTKEDHLELPSTAVSPRIYVSTSSSFSDHEAAQGDYSSYLKRFSSLDLRSELLMAKGQSPLTPSQPSGHRISICWKPNNYSSVTMEGAELIEPIVELQYNE